MKIFGYTILILTEEEMQDIADAKGIRLRAVQAYRWFSGWKDLDVLFDYLLGLPLERPWGNVEYARKEYAKRRGTDEYGNEIEE